MGFGTIYIQLRLVIMCRNFLDYTKKNLISVLNFWFRRV